MGIDKKGDVHLSSIVTVMPQATIAVQQILPKLEQNYGSEREREGKGGGGARRRNLFWDNLHKKDRQT